MYNEIIKYDIEDILNNKTILNSKYLSSGLVGSVYLISNNNNNNNNIIVKKQLLDDRFKYELYVHNNINKIIDSVCPHYLYFYGYQIKTINNKEYVYFFMENASGSFIESFDFKFTNKQFKSFCFQILYAIYILNDYLNVCHEDIKHDNIMYKSVNKDLEYEYTINNNNNNSYKFRVPLYGKMYVIIDFGRSRNSKLSRNKKNKLDYRTKECLSKITDIRMFTRFISRMYYLLLIEDDDTYNIIMKRFKLKKDYRKYYNKLYKENRHESIFDKREINY